MSRLEQKTDRIEWQKRHSNTTFSLDVLKSFTRTARASVSRKARPMMGVRLMWLTHRQQKYTRDNFKRNLSRAIKEKNRQVSLK